MKCFLFGEHAHDAVNDEKRESSTIECGEWQEIEYSEIDTDKRCDEEYNSECDLGIQEIHKEISDGDRPSETLDGFRAFCRSVWTDDPLDEGAQEL